MIQYRHEPLGEDGEKKFSSSKGYLHSHYEPTYSKKIKDFQLSVPY